MTTQKRIAFDPWLAILLGAAALLGAFNVWDAAYPTAILKGQSAIPMDFIKHLMGLVLGFGAFAIVSRFSHRKLYAAGHIFFWLTFFLCILVLIPGIGKDNGTNAYRWLGYGIFSLQPAELMKPAAIVFLACFASITFPAFGKRRRDIIEKLDNAAVPFFCRAFPLLSIVIAFILIEKEPDLGTAVIVLSIAFGIMMFGLGKHICGRRWPLVLGVGTAIALCGMLYFTVAQGYRAERFAAHANRWDPAVIDGRGFQPAQAELAMAVGGVAGVGVGQGRAKHVLPMATSDFAIVTLFEEFGILGVFVVLIILGGITFRLLYLATFVDDPFRRLVVQGTAWWIGTQSIANLLMAGSLIPAVGIPVPFFSAGNSSLLALGIALGACMAALRSRRAAEVAYATGRHRGRNRRPRLSRA